MKVTHSGKAWLAAFSTGVCSLGAATLWTRERYFASLSSLAVAGLGIAVFDRCIEGVANNASQEAN